MWLKALPGQHIQFWVSLPARKKQLSIPIILVHGASPSLTNELSESRRWIERKNTKLRTALLNRCCATSYTLTHSKK